jgi:hypothetical protein
VPIDMSVDMTLAVSSLVASVVSFILGLIAIGLSLTFYIQANRSNTAASQTLARVETLVSTIQQHAFGMLQETIERISSTASPPNPGLLDTVPQARSDEGDDKQNSALNAEADALSKLYAAEMQLNNPMYGAVFGMIGGAPMVETERQRIRALIAIKRAQLEKQYGVKFDSQPQLTISTDNQKVDPAVK